jgi:hypothetical protein
MQTLTTTFILLTGTGVTAMDKLLGMVSNAVGWLKLVVAICFSIYFGFIIIPNLFLYFQQASDPQKKKEAKDKLTYAVVGLAVTWIASLLVDVLMEVGTKFFGA